MKTPRLTLIELENTSFANENKRPAAAEERSMSHGVSAAANDGSGSAGMPKKKKLKKSGKEANVEQLLGQAEAMARRERAEVVVVVERTLGVAPTLTQIYPVTVAAVNSAEGEKAAEMGNGSFVVKCSVVFEFKWPCEY
jgi:hypothetical protein